VHGLPPGSGHKVSVRKPFHSTQPEGEGHRLWSSTCPCLARGSTARDWSQGFFGFGFCPGKDLQVSNYCSFLYLWVSSSLYIPSRHY